MKAPAPADLQRWSEEVARDPASLSFVPLARAFRKQGRRDAAFKLCMRGLEHHPTLVEGHALLAMLYFESGQRAKAYDEWSMVLRLEPENFEALRGMGFYHLEQGDEPAALRSLQRAAAIKPKDITVQEALKIIREKEQPVEPLPEPMPWETPSEVFGQEPERRTAVAAPPEPSAPTPAPAPDSGGDPTRLFDPITRGGQILGAILLDEQGLVLAGSLSGETTNRAEALGAILGPAIEEAARTALHLELGSWKGILLEAEDALLHLAPVGAGMIVLLAARKETPAGWMLRSAHQATTLASRFLEAYA
jgi:tetratricopeptide (TPR) repeat protein